MKKFIKNNALSIVFLFLFIISIIGQFITGLEHHNEERAEDGMPAVTTKQYIITGHFLQSTFENWESEFLQMGLFVVLTIFLIQKGSSESKSEEGKEPVDREPSSRRKGAPWPVRKGGWVLGLYKHSLSIVLFLMFLLSFLVHWYGSMKDENEKLSHQSRPLKSAVEYLGESRFWFESFQNWQSEFLSVFVLVVFSIFLRQKGSPQSKPVDASHDETGSEG